MSDAAAAFDHLSRHWVWLLAGASWRGGIVLAFAWAVTLLPLRWPARVQCWLWRVGYLSLFVTLCWTIPIDLPLDRRPVAPPTDVPPPTLAGLPDVSARQAVVVRSVVHDAPAISLHTPSPPSLAPPRKVILHPPLEEILFLAWTIMGLIQAVRLLRASLATKKLRRSGNPIANAQLQALASELAERLGIKQPPLLLASETPNGPLLLGLRQPAILLPFALLGSCDEKQIRLLLAHELAHLRRRDLLWNWLPAIGGMFFGFHPLVWIARRQWRAAQEMACDEAAIAATDAPPADYGRMLLYVASRSTPCLPALVGVGAAGSRRNLQRRLSAMKHFPQWSRRRLTVTGMVITTFTLLSIAPWRVVAQQPSAPSSVTPSPSAMAGRSPATAPSAATTAPTAAESMGHIIANTVSLTAPIDGTIQEIKFDDGQSVDKGQLLVQFNDQRQKALLAEAEVKLRGAASKLRLFEEAVNDVSKADLEDAKAAVETGQAELAVRQSDLAACRVLAPFAGRMGIANASPGQTLRQGDSIATLVETGSPKVEFQLPEFLLGKVHRGQSVRVWLPSSRDHPMGEGTIYYIAPQVNSNSGTFTVRANLTGDAEQLVPGRACRVAVEASNAENGTTAPPSRWAP